MLTASVRLLNLPPRGSLLGFSGAVPSRQLPRRTYGRPSTQHHRTAAAAHTRDSLRSAPEVADNAAKVLQLSQEGLTSLDIATLFQGAAPGAWGASYEQVFLPNLAYLRGLLSHLPQPHQQQQRGQQQQQQQQQGKRRWQQHAQEGGLTALGRLLHSQPADMALVLSSSPTQLAALDYWVTQELGVPREQLAAAVLRSPSILLLPVEGGRAVAGFLGEELGLPREQVAGLLLTQSPLFRFPPELLRRRLAALLGEGAAVEDVSQAAASLVLAEPGLLVSLLTRRAAAEGPRPRWARLFTA